MFLIMTNCTLNVHLWSILRVAKRVRVVYWWLCLVGETASIKIVSGIVFPFKSGRWWFINSCFLVFTTFFFHSIFPLTLTVSLFLSPTEILPALSQCVARNWRRLNCCWSVWESVCVFECYALLCSFRVRDVLFACTFFSCIYVWLSKQV